MKRLSALLLVTLLGTAAHAGGTPSQDPTQSPIDLSKGPVITEVEQRANLMPPVQEAVRTTVTVEYSSCADLSEALEVEALNGSKGTLLLASLRPIMDCHHGKTPHEAKLSVEGLPVLDTVRTLQNGSIVTLDVISHVVY